MQKRNKQMFKIASKGTFSERFTKGFFISPYKIHFMKIIPKLWAAIKLKLFEAQNT